MLIDCMKYLKQTMRLLILLLIFSCAMLAPVLGANDTIFDDFIRSREIVATLYFQTNSDGISDIEKERLSGMIAEIRNLQNTGRMIRVEGFSSPGGDQEKNFYLSFFRARAVADIIEAEGLPEEIALTAYGDLRAKSEDPSKERRVEIASYIKPIITKKVEIATRKQRVVPVSAPTITPKEPEIDSYRIDQAIRSKIEDKKKGIADKSDDPDTKSVDADTDKKSPGLSQSEEERRYRELQRDYSHWRKTVDPDYSPELSESQQESDFSPKRGYSQLKELNDPESSPGVSQSEEDIKSRELEQDYSQWRKTVDPDSSPEMSESQQDETVSPNRGYSQLRELNDPEFSPGVGQVIPVTSPDIDAFMIEQAIREKIASERSKPSGAVSQVLQEY